LRRRIIVRTRRWFSRVAVVAVCSCGGIALAQTQPVRSIASVESDYADLLDAAGAISLIDSGSSAAYGGQSRDAWQRTHDQLIEKLSAELTQARTQGLAGNDARAIEIMRKQVTDLRDASSLAPGARCADASSRTLEYTALTQALYACFDTLANQLEFEGGRVTRMAAFDLLTRMEEPALRKALFHAFQPLWKAVNGANELDSPYRRLIRMAAEKRSSSGSPIDAAARTVGASPEEIERWLVRILDAWREAIGGELVEPWDYMFVGGAAQRQIGPHVSRDALQPINERFFLDLGVDLKKWGTLYDLTPRPGKAPLAYTDYVRRGRTVDGAWRPTLARVSANYQNGGLGSLHELVHENGHVVHMMALHTRPAFMDLGDAVFYEAFADVLSWSTYEPAWQKKYLGRSSSEAAALRGLYSNVVLDVAWSLFELRMLRDPASDPNAVWTDITHRYLHVKPHPELAWWAVRVQLVDSPGYMVYYGLGAVLTADMRKRIQDRLGPFTTGDARWFDWVASRLLASGMEKDTSVLLREFLGRPTSPDALLAQLRRIKAAKHE
jgi:hypothetical protein